MLQTARRASPDPLGWPSSSTPPSGFLGWPSPRTPPDASRETVPERATVARGGVSRETVPERPTVARRGVSRETVGSVSPEALRAGVARDTAPDSPIADRLHEHARRRRSLTGRRAAKPRTPRIVAVSNQKGGVGKTTTAVNVAAALAESGLTVLVIDVDPQGNASTALGVDHHVGALGVYDVLIEHRALIRVVQECPDVPNLWCAPATIDLAGAEIELVDLPNRETRLREAITRLRSHLTRQGRPQADYIIIDCPPSLGLLTLNALVAADDVLIPIQCEYYALEGLTQLMKTIGLVADRLNPGLSVSSILMTMYDGRTRLAAQVADEVRAHFPREVLKATIPRAVRVSEAPSFGQTILTYDPTGTGALSYREAAYEFAARGAADKTDPSGGRPLYTLGTPA